MSQSELEKCLRKYFQQTSKLDPANEEKLLQLLDRFATYGDQLKVIRMLFEMMQNSVSRQNLKTVTKKYFYLMNLVLEKDQKLPDHKKYRTAVSHQIITHYYTILSQLLKYDLTELIMIAKIYRKKWARRITDEAFERINSEAIKQLNFDLDRGFSEDIIEKILKLYKKRNFTQSEIDKYMNSQPKRPQPQPTPHKSESSQQEQNSPRKRVKRITEPALLGHDMMNHHSYIPSNSFPMHQKYPVHNSYSHFPPPGQYPYTPELVRPGMPPKFDYQYSNKQLYPSKDPNSYYLRTPVPTQPLFPHQEIRNQPHYGNIYPPHDPYAVTHLRKSDPRVHKAESYPKNNEALQKLKKLQLYQCRYCGVELSTYEHFSKHTEEHFSEHLKEFETLHSRRDNAQKKPLLPTIEEWVNSSKRIKQQVIPHYVPIKGALGSDRYQEQECTICRSRLRISWSFQLSQWVYQDSIRICCQGESQDQIGHYECYNTIEEVASRFNL